MVTTPRAKARASARTTDVSIWRSGIDQYWRSRRSFSGGETQALTRFSPPFAIQDPQALTGWRQATKHLLPTRCWVVGRLALFGGNIRVRSNAARPMATPP